MIINLWTKILHYTWKIWQIILSPEDVCFQFQYPQIIFQPICQFEFMIKKIGVQFFSQLNHPRENMSSWQTFVCKRNFVWVLTTYVFTQSFKYFWLQWPSLLIIISTASFKTISNETEILFVNMHICEEYSDCCYNCCLMSSRRPMYDSL